MNKGSCLPRAVDVVVVGGGMAGITLARGLQEAGVDVLVVEAGPASPQEHYRAELSPESANRSWITPTTDPHLWRPYTTADGSFQDLAGLRSRLGGRGLYWHGACIPIEDSVLETSWPRAVTRDLLSHDIDVPGSYARVLHRIGKWQDTDAESVSATQAFELGGFSLSRMPMATRRGATPGRWSAYSPDPHGLAVATRARVVDVMEDGGQASGVRVAMDGKMHIVRSRVVALCGAAIESSRLAIQALYARGSLTTPKLSGLVDKLAQGFVTSVPASGVGDSLLVAARSAALYHVPLDLAVPSRLYAMCRMSDSFTVTVDCYIMSEQERHHTNGVTCDNLGSTPWSASLRLGPSDADAEQFELQRSVLRSIWRSLNVAHLGSTSELAFPDSMSGRELGDVLVPTLPPKEGETQTYLFPPGSEHHEGGTLPFGELVDDDGQLFGLAGLYTVGAATFPRSGAANPALTILALADRTAAAICRNLNEVAV